MIIAGIPAYNEEKTIAKVILLAQKQVDIVIVCDDGSQDMTADIAQRLGAVVIRHNENLGYGQALRSVFKKARDLNADILLTLDADAQHDAREIPRLVQQLAEDKADIVVGSRFLEKSNNVPTYRRLGIKFLTKVTNGYGGGNNLSDAQCGFRAYSRRAIESLKIREAGMGASAEILLSAKDEGLRVVEVPVQTHYKDLDTSTHNPLKHGLSVFATILRLIVEERPLFYLGIPGAIFLLVGLLFGIWTLQIFASEGHIITNIALTAVGFGLVGIFVIFTAITLYAILTLTEKISKS